MPLLPDVDTLRLCSLLASTAFGVVFVALWLRDRGETHLLYWATGSCLYGVVIFGFSQTPRGEIPLTTLLFSGLGLTNVVALSGVRRLDGRPPFRWWMLIPIAAAGLGHGGPRLAVELGWLPPTSLIPNIGDALGLSLSMAINGGAMLWGRWTCRTAGHRIVGAALLAYIPAYALSIAGEYGALRGMEMLALFAMLSDQALLGIINLGLLAIPVERAQRQLRQAALRDPLTGAWNRAGLEVQKPRLLAVGATAIAIDIDHFKTINDYHGHAAGDRILALFGREAGRLSQAQGGELARLGGDEFAILLPAACPDPERFAKQLRAHLHAQSDDAISWSVSMGMAVVLEQEDDFDAALHRADSALYQAKAEGRGLIAARVPRSPAVAGAADGEEACLAVGFAERRS
jgi:diguanylate cyclase (GGDEF)-like protein